MSLWGEPFGEGRINDWKKMERVLLSPAWNRQGYRAGGCARRSLRRGWGSRALSVLQVYGIPPLCPAVSHPAVLSLRAWDMLTRGGDTTWKNLRLSWKDAKPSQFQGAKITQQGPAAT